MVFANIYILFIIFRCEMNTLDNILLQHNDSTVVVPVNETTMNTEAALPKNDDEYRYVVAMVAIIKVMLLRTMYGRCYGRCYDVTVDVTDDVTGLNTVRLHYHGLFANTYILFVIF